MLTLIKQAKVISNRKSKIKKKKTITTANYRKSKPKLKISAPSGTTRFEI